ncbi:putative metal-nicotianamine transporter YSL12 [Dendrobium catenatum]|uniref:Putative metal-nicotianamine transporter YSL12 n=1 Tax=Dendrobium catenatum TaxID=906689 RepID=A0A2I0XG62_9ASPA|nr:putative metal-nicotianamine transporter YSL12 [Dendrobium catenatum]
MIILTHRDSQKPVDLRKSTTRGVRTQRVEEQLTHRGCQKPVGLQNSTALGVRTQRVFISTAMIHSDGLYNFIMVLIKTIPAIIAHAWSKNMDNTLPLTENGFPATNDTIKWYHILVTYIFTQVLAFYNAYGCGLTNWSLESINGKLAIFIFGAWVGASHGGVLAGLATCGVVINNVSTASDLMQDFKTGYLTLASPRSMFISQVIRTVMGSVIAPCVFWLFYKAFADLGVPGTEYPAPGIEARREEEKRRKKLLLDHRWSFAGPTLEALTFVRPAPDAVAPLDHHLRPSPPPDHRLMLVLCQTTT